MLTGFHFLPVMVRNLEAILFVDAVRRHNGNRAVAARELGINPSTLFRKVKALGIQLFGPSDGRRNHKESRPSPPPFIHIDRSNPISAERKRGFIQ